MPRKQLDRRQKLEMERALRSLMTGYPTIQDPILRAKVRSKVSKAMREFDVQPYPGYSTLPSFMRE
jgi:hypothetical protein